MPRPSYLLGSEFLSALLGNIHFWRVRQNDTKVSEFEHNNHRGVCQSDNFTTKL